MSFIKPLSLRKLNRTACNSTVKPRVVIVVMPVPVPVPPAAPPPHDFLSRLPQGLSEPTTVEPLIFG